MAHVLKSLSLIIVFMISDSPASSSRDPTLFSNLVALLISTRVGSSCIQIKGSWADSFFLFLFFFTKNGKRRILIYILLIETFGRCQISSFFQISPLHSFFYLFEKLSLALLIWTFKPQNFIFGTKQTFVNNFFQSLMDGSCHCYYSNMDQFHTKKSLTLKKEPKSV